MSIDAVILLKPSANTFYERLALGAPSRIFPEMKISPLLNPIC